MSPIDTLKRTMAALGIDAAGLTFSEMKEQVMYPGGSYENHQIVVTDGIKSEQYDVALTVKSPMVTAYGIQRYFGFAGAADGRK